MYRMHQIVKMIHDNGSATLVLKGETIEIGFHGSGKPGILTMLGGGYYYVSTADNRRFEIAKGQLLALA